MPWRFNLPLTGIRVASRDTAGHLVHDRQLNRYRWAFGPFLDQARARAGGTLALAQAVALVGPELALALDHIDTHPADENIFGVMYDVDTGALAQREAAESADQERKNAATFLKNGVAGGAEDAADFIPPALEILYDAIRERDPNNLMAALLLVPCLYHTKQELVALAEWCDVYCRAASFTAVMEKVPARDDPVLLKTRRAYEGSLKGGVATELATQARLLGAETLFDASRVPALSAPKYYDQLIEVTWYVRTNALANLQSAIAGAAVSYGTGVVYGVRNSLRALFAAWKKTHLRIYPRPMKEVLIACLAAYDTVLTKDTDAKRKLAAAESLGEIPLLETVDVLKKHAANPDPAIVKAVSQSIVAVGRSVSGIL